MSYFSRLTDIVTCNLSKLLNETDNPRAAIADIVREMEEGLAGAQRSVTTAGNSEQRLSREIDDHRAAAAAWTEKARKQLAAHSEPLARECLLRKREVEDLIAGLEQQHKAAVATKEHLATMQRALEARLAEAIRKRESLGAALAGNQTAANSEHSLPPARSLTDDRQQEIDAELEALKRELGT
jgi:phage shock protein A